MVSSPREVYGKGSPLYYAILYLQMVIFTTLST